MSLQLLKSSIALVESNAKASAQQNDNKLSMQKSKKGKSSMNINKKLPKKINKAKEPELNQKLLRLLAFSQSTLKKEDANKILKRKGKCGQIKTTKPKQESIFTEEDFQALDEYLEATM